MGTSLTLQRSEVLPPPGLPLLTCNARVKAPTPYTTTPCLRSTYYGDKRPVAVACVPRACMRACVSSNARCAQGDLCRSMRSLFLFQWCATTTTTATGRCGDQPTALQPERIKFGWATVANILSDAITQWCIGQWIYWDHLPEWPDGESKVISIPLVDIFNDISVASEVSTPGAR